MAEGIAPEELEVISAVCSKKMLDHFRTELQTEATGSGDRADQTQLPNDRHQLVRRAYNRSESARQQIDRIGTEVDALQSALEVDRKDAVYDFLRALDARSRGIVEYVWWNKHASVRELATVTDAETDMEILILIRDRINPEAQAKLDGGILEFVDRRIDPQTGNIVTFEWWFRGDRAPESIVQYEVNAV